MLLHIVETYDQIRDDLFKWFHLPYLQAKEGLEAFERDLPSAKKRELFPTASLILPRMVMMPTVTVHVDRQLAALRCIEALRLYAASHQGKLPAALDEIREVPIPLNPATGKLFGYRLEGKTAVLDADGDLPFEKTPQYRITVAN